MKIGDNSKSKISHIDDWREVSKAKVDPLALILEAMSSQILELAQRSQDGKVSAHLFAITCNITALANHLKLQGKNEIKQDDVLDPAKISIPRSTGLVCDLKAYVGDSGGINRNEQ